MSRSLSPRAKVVLYGVLMVLAIPFVFPTWWMVTSSFKPVSEIFAYPPSLWPSSPRLEAYQRVFELQPFERQYVNSLYIALVVTLGTMAVASLSGYAFARIRFRGQNVLFLVVLAGLLIPSEVTIVPLFQMFLRFDLIDTHWPLILVPIFGAPSVLATFIMRQFFISLPMELEEAARVDGLGRFATFWRIVLPLSRPAPSSRSCTAGISTWSPSSTSPPRRSSLCRRRSRSSPTRTAVQCGTSSWRRRRSRPCRCSSSSSSPSDSSSRASPTRA